MDRRQFIRNSALTAGALMSLPAFASRFPDPDLVIVKGGDPVTMLEEGLEALGGLERFIEKGQKVLIKPDIGWNRTPEQGANTNPELLGRLVEMCYQAKAREVHVVDHTHDEWTKCYKNSGIERQVKDASAKIWPANKEFLYKKTEIPEAKKLKEALLHQQLFETDILINVPVLKKDETSGISGGLQNLAGLVWDWEQLESQGRDQCLIDLLHFRKPVLNLVDAYRVITKNGPAGNSPDDVSLLRTLILSPDIVAADAAGAELLGIDPQSVTSLRLAAQAGWGTLKPNAGSVKQINL